MTTPDTRTAAVRLGLALLLGLGACGPDDATRPAGGEVELTLAILDADTGEPTPARVELLDTTGRGHVAGDALPVLQPVAEEPPAAPIETRLEAGRRFHNPQTGTDQFYSTGTSTLRLAPGAYHLRVWKGLEYKPFEAWIEVAPGESSRREVPIERWIDMPRSGWYGADGHIHLPRPTPEANPALARWMAAEDIHVANLLQMGAAGASDFAPQYAHGEAGHHAAGHHLLVSGQENPRTHFLGHAVILGTSAPIHYPESYLDLRRVFAEGRRQGALNGFAHFGRHAGARTGIGLVLPHGLLDFLEVLQFGRGEYDVWYKILDTGLRLSPTAGSDYPWAHGPPGKERFYTRVPRELTVERWIEAVRAGHTFVTNGPMLGLRVDGRIMGETVELAAPGTVEIEARTMFHPKRDLVSVLELVENGVVVRSFPVGPAGSSRISRRFRHEVRASGWLAIRVRGLAQGQPPVRQALAHSAPVYLSVAGTPPLARGEEAKRLARSWIALLDDLEADLADERIQELAERLASAPVPLETIRRERPALLAALREARERFRERSR